MITKHKIVEDFFNTEIPKEIEKFVSYNLAITEEIILHLRAKGWKKKDLAIAMGKKESEISKILSGSHNLTTNTLAKISVALGKDIILTPMQAEKLYEKTKLVPIGVYMNDKPKSSLFNFSTKSFSNTLKKVS